MRKNLFWGCVAATVLSVCACANLSNDNGVNTVYTEQSTEQTVGQVLTDEKIKWLIDENIYCNLHVFEMNSLSWKDEQIEYEGRTLYPVNEEKFVDFAAFEEYVRSVYCRETAELYLYKSPYEETPQYVNVDGKLYVDISCVGGKGYYVDWTDYSFEIKSQTEERCEFTVTASVEWPAEVPQKELYSVDAVAVFEDGKWVLEKMIY